MTGWWCEHALVDGRVRNGVTITAADGFFTSIEADTPPPSGFTRLNGLTLPGFANAHSHAFHRALRSRVQAERGTFWTWRELMYRAAERLNPDNYHRLARAVFAEMVLAGMTVVGEFHYVHNRPTGAPYDDPNAMGVALLAAADDAGIRITLLDTLYMFGGIESKRYSMVAGVQQRFADQSAADWVGRVQDLVPGTGQRIGGAIHSVRAVDPGAMQEVAVWASRRGVPLHAHVSEQRAENEQLAARFRCTPTEMLESVGALETDFTAIHATHLSPRDVELLGQNSASVCLCPTTERDLGDGIGPSPELVRAGASLCLGSDSHAVIDHLLEARTVEMNERLRSESRGIHSAAELIDMATTAGHRSLGWDDAGMLKVGNRADLVTISLDSVRNAGTMAEVMLESAVFASTASDVTTVVIDGRTMVSGGHHQHLDVPGELAAAISELMH